jgi:ribosomal protein L37AE/L43A
MNRGSGNPLALGLVIVGAFAMAIAAFLPLDEPAGVFRMVEHNTLIQHSGWQLIVLGVGIAAAGFRVSQRKGNGWAFPVVLCVLAAIRIVMWATDKDLRTLYPVGPDGTLINSQPGTAVPLGIAVYVAGAGVGVALIGSLMLRQTEKSVAEDSLVAAWEAEKTTKKCPDCAETVLADAKVCKHCGYRFAAGVPADPQTLAPGKTSKVRCHKCQHVQVVPLSQSVFVCEQCNTKLKRQTKSAKSS